jgi:hypothetical protein
MDVIHQDLQFGGRAIGLTIGGGAMRLPLSKIWGIAALV